MRTIKYRGQLRHSKQWVEGNLIIAKDGHPYIIPSNFLEPDGHHLIIDSDNPFLVIPESVGQFTGLTDKNGVEIYEADFIKFTRNQGYHTAGKNRPFEVKHFNFAFCGFGVMQHSPLTQKKSNECIVLGNIHDNPELIK